MLEVFIRIGRIS